MLAISERKVLTSPQEFQEWEVLLGVYLYSSCYTCLLFRQAWGVTAIPWYLKQPQLPRAPSQNIFVMFSDCWPLQMEGTLLMETFPGLVRISTVVAESAQPHHVKCGFPLLPMYWVNCTFFFTLCFMSL